MVQHEARIRNGMVAYDLLQQLRGGNTTRQTVMPLIRAKDLRLRLTAETLYR